MKPIVSKTKPVEKKIATPKKAPDKKPVEQNETADSKPDAPEKEPEQAPSATIEETSSAPSDVIEPSIAELTTEPATILPKVTLLEKDPPPEIPTPPPESNEKTVTTIAPPDADTPAFEDIKPAEVQKPEAPKGEAAATVLPVEQPAAAPVENTKIIFASGETTINSEMQEMLKSKIAKALNDTPDMRLQLKSYAAAMPDSPSSARRISLSRVLTIRAYLMELGISPDRMDVRALGDQTTEAPKDRVDLEFVK